MSDAIIQVLKKRYHLGHERILKMIEGLTDEQFHWQASATSHSIAFNVWHVGRWTDYFQATVPDMDPSLRGKFGPREQIWLRDGLAARWSLDPSALGWSQMGTEMDDTAAANLVLSDGPAVVAYARQTFGIAEQTVDALEDDDLRAICRNPAESDSEHIVCSHVVSQIAHNEFHRGQIASIRRAMNLPRVWRW